MFHPDAFPALNAGVHFNHAGVAPLSGPAAQAFLDYAHHARQHGPAGSGWYRRIEQVRAAAARLIHAPTPSAIAFVPNTSTGLATVARGLPFKPGQRIVTTDVEYPANRYVWEDLMRLGVELVTVPQQPDGRIDLEDLLAAINDRTRLVAVSHVQYASGFRIDLEPLADEVHRAGGFLCVDAIQSVGALPVDVQAMGIDFLAADGHKWMLGPEGAGIFYCRPDLIERLHPPVVGWLNMVDAHDYDRYLFRFRADAGRFEPGSYNVPGLLALGASLDLLLAVGIDAISGRIDALTTQLANGLQARGHRVFSPRTHAHERSGIVSFTPRKDDAAAMMKQLAHQGITLALRAGRLRASPHAYNTPEQVDRLLAALEA